MGTTGWILPVSVPGMCINLWSRLEIHSFQCGKIRKNVELVLVPDSCSTASSHRCNSYTYASSPSSLNTQTIFDQHNVDEGGDWMVQFCITHFAFLPCQVPFPSLDHLNLLSLS